MKIKITLKSPDALYACVHDAVVEAMPDDLEAGEFRETVTERMNQLFDGPLCRWIAYRELVTIEIDTEAGTARVCERS